MSPKQVFPDHKKEEFDSPHLPLKLSEIVVLAVLKDPRIQELFPHEPSIYNEWRTMNIRGKPLLDHMQEIYDTGKSFEDFMEKSWDFIEENKSAFI